MTVNREVLESVGGNVPAEGERVGVSAKGRIGVFAGVVWLELQSHGFKLVGAQRPSRFSKPNATSRIAL
jgi:hypothetical protein